MKLTKPKRSSYLLSFFLLSKEKRCRGEFPNLQVRASVFGAGRNVPPLLLLRRRRREILF